LYRARDGGNLLEKNRLLKIEEMEQKMQSFGKWKEVCLATSTEDTTCSPISYISSLSFLYAGGVFTPLKDRTQEEIEQAFYGVMGNDQAWS